MVTEEDIFKNRTRRIEKMFTVQEMIGMGSFYQIFPQPRGYVTLGHGGEMTPCASHEGRNSGIVSILDFIRILN